MPDSKPQNFANHRKLVLPYHGVAFLLIVVNAGYAAWMTITKFSVANLMYLLLVAAVFLVFWYARVFAVGVQDRVIRLEERLRFEGLLPDALKPRIGDFTVAQLVGLRFASDAELPALAQEVLDRNIEAKDEIKKRVREWRADHCRV
jgi:hypothetical protein